MKGQAGECTPVACLWAAGSPRKLKKGLSHALTEIYFDSPPRRSPYVGLGARDSGLGTAVAVFHFRFPEHFSLGHATAALPVGREAVNTRQRRILGSHEPHGAQEVGKEANRPHQ